MSTINETLKQKIDELDLDRRMNEAVESGEQLLKHALETVGGLAHERRDDLDRVLDKVSEAIAERTEGKYADRVDQVRSQLDSGLDKLAERRGDDTV